MFENLFRFSICSFISMFSSAEIVFNSGFLGREAIIELLNVDTTVRQIIYDGSMSQLHQYLEHIQFGSFRVAAIEKIITGVTTLSEVLRVLPHSALYR